MDFEAIGGGSSLLLAAWTAAVGLGLGASLLTVLDVRRDLSRPERFALAFAAGYGVYGYVVLLLGAMGLLRPLPLFLLPSVLCLPGLRGALGAATSGGGSRERIAAASRERLLLAWTCTPLLIAGVCALAPPAGFDTYSYHLPLPKAYAAAQRVYFALEVHPQSAAWPQQGEMPFVAPHLVGAPLAPNLLSWTHALAIAALLAGGLSRWASRRAGLIAAGLFLSVPSVVQHASDAYPDLLTALYSLGSLIALAEWWTSRRAGFLQLGLLLAGLAAATKIVGLFSLLFAWVAAGAGLLRERRPRDVRSTALALVLGLAAAAPWYVRSWIRTGDPVFPFLAGVFRSPLWTEFATTAHRQMGWGGLLWGGSLSDFLMLPFRASFADAGPGPLYLALFPLALGAWRAMPARVRLAAGYAVSAALFFALSSHQIRLAFAMLGAMAAVLGWWLDVLLQRRRGDPLTRAAVAALAVWAAYSVAANVRFNRERLMVAGGATPRASFLARRLPHYPDFREMNRTLPERSRVLLWTIQGYFLERDYLTMIPWQQGLIDFGALRDAAGFVRRLRELGITHVYYMGAYEMPADRFETVWRLHAAAESGGQFSLVRDFGGQRKLYRLKD